MKKAIFCLLLLSTACCAFSQMAAQDTKGKIAGKLIDHATGEGLIGATVQIEGAAGGSVTDMDGKFLLSLAPGAYTLVFSYISYQTQKMDVEVKPNEVTYVNFVMKESDNALTEVVITYTI
ncbi:MAG: carboxypeptidase-like regulatory domain-containing protein, partial [Saprospiraceae bacterium]